MIFYDKDLFIENKNQSILISTNLAFYIQSIIYIKYIEYTNLFSRIHPSLFHLCYLA